MEPKKESYPHLPITAEISEELGSAIQESEAFGRLTEKQLTILYSQKWFNLFVPEKFGGLGLPLPEALELEERLAWIDGNLGWTVTLCSGANWFIGFLNPSLSEKLFQTPKVCLAGSGRPSGTAKIMEDGFEITGLWHYATGADHATAFTANCVLQKGGILQLDKEGNPQVRSFLFLREEVTILHDWNCFGMMATSSHSFEVDHLKVAKDRCFIIDSHFAALDEPVYRYPFLQFAEATLAVNLAGMAGRFIELCEMIFSQRFNNRDYPEIQPQMKAILEQSGRELSEIRSSFYSVIRNSWEKCQQFETIPSALLEEVSIQSKTLANISRKLAENLFPYCGMVAANKNSAINSVWRNIHTASQHSLLL